MQIDNLYRSTCPPVSVDEMAFAIALFVAAANGRLMPKVSYANDREIEVGYDPTVAGARAIAADSCEQFSCELPLVRAVGFIWQHYDQDNRRQAICSRLIAYYHMMNHNRGPAIEQAESLISQLTYTRLSAPMLEAIATAPLDARAEPQPHGERGTVAGLKRSAYGEKIETPQGTVSTTASSRKGV